MQADNEEFLDKEINPVLAELMQRCHDRGMSFIAVVDYNGLGHTSRTYGSVADSPPIFKWLDALAQCGEERGFNVDKFMFAVMREAEKTGHSSVVLTMLKVPESLSNH